MRADVAENSTVLVRVPEPIGPRICAARIASAALGNLVRCDINGLDHLADRALAHEFARVDCSFYFKQLAVHDRVDALGFGDGHAHLG